MLVIWFILLISVTLISAKTRVIRLLTKRHISLFIDVVETQKKERKKKKSVYQTPCKVGDLIYISQ